MIRKIEIFLLTVVLVVVGLSFVKSKADTTVTDAYTTYVNCSWTDRGDVYLCRYGPYASNWFFCSQPRKESYATCPSDVNTNCYYYADLVSGNCGTYYCSNDAPSKKYTCHYISAVNTWSACEDGVQVAEDVTWSTTEGKSCSNVATTRSCSVCGNGTCEAGETSDLCPADCGATGSCGDGICSEGETSSNCYIDCPPSCGNGVCEPGENCSLCPSDCSAICGNNQCECGETRTSCPSDCAVCGDSYCTSAGGENEETCSTDCPASCGNNLCGAGEDVSCPEDCGPVCGNEQCENEKGENFLNCPTDCAASLEEF